MMLLKIFLDTEVKISYNTTMKNQIAVKKLSQDEEVLTMLENIDLIFTKI